MKTISFLVRLVVVVGFSTMILQAQQPQGWVTLDGSDLPPIQVYAEGEEPPTPAPTLRFSEIYPVSNSVAAVGNEADVATPEIIELARGLEYSPEKIFTWVRDNIAFTHYYGVVKGAALTLEERSGNDADTCALMVSLLRQCAAVTSASYVQGVTKIPLSGAAGSCNMADYLGVDPDTTLIEDLILNRGTPVDDCVLTTVNSQFVYRMKRFWVRATTLAGTVDYDPSFKIHQRIAGINFATASGYSRSALSTAAAGTLTSGEINGLKLTATETAMRNQAATFTDWVRNQFPQGSRKDLIGEVKQVPITASWAGNSRFPLESDATPEVVAQALPSSLFSKVRVRAGSLDVTFDIAKLRGRTFWLRFQPQAVLCLDDEVVATEMTMPSSTQLDFRLDLDHLGTRLDQGSDPKTLPRRGVRTISYGFRGNLESLRKHQRILERLRAMESNPDAPRVKAEALSVMGSSWVAQTQGLNEVVGAVTQTSVLFFHRFGFVADEHDAALQQGSYYIDFPMQLTAADKRSPTSDSTNFVPTSAFLSSAMEHAVISQMQAGDQAASAAGLISSLSDGVGGDMGKRYLATSANWASVKADLVNYASADLTVIETAINAGGTALLPKSGKIPVKNWSGAGYIIQYAATTTVKPMGALITGGYKGGHAGLIEAISTYAADYIAKVTSSQRNSSPPTQKPVTGGDPVNMSTGQFVQDADDLVIGTGVPPTGLTFSRSYDGANRYIDSVGLGAGWSHSLKISAKRSSDIELACGNAGAVDTAAMVLGVLTTYDFFKNRSSVKDWTLSVIAANYVANRLTNNVVCVQLPDRVLQFHRLPGGEFADSSYTPPSSIQTKFQPPNGVTAVLKAMPQYTYTPSSPPHGGVGPIGPGSYELNGESYALEERNGRIWEFFGNETLSKVTDPDGKWAGAVSSTATSTTYQDFYGRQLTLNYDSTRSRLLSVSDSAGRSVSYTVVGGVLTSVADPENKKTYFEYDAAKRLTKIKNHAQAVIVENTVFDSQHRVIEQKSQGDAARIWRYYYLPGETIEENPLGEKTRHLFDDLKRNIGTINALGHRMKKEYDGQDHLVKAISPMGFQSKSAYNADHTVASVTDALDKITTMAYDANKRLTITTLPTGQQTQVNAYNAQHKPLTTTNAAGIVTNYTYINNTTKAKGELTKVQVNGLTKETRIYNAEGLLWLVYAGQDNWDWTTSTYYTALGDVERTTTILGATTLYEYNARRQVTKMTLKSSAPNSSLVTTYTYNDNGDLETVTNPRGFTTTTLYNVLGKPVETILPDGSRNLISYDLADRPIAVTDTLNQTVTSTLDAAGQATHVTDPLNRTTVTAYDADGRAETVTDALSRLSRTVYNARGEVASTKQPDNLGISNTYDDAGRPLTLTNRSGNTWAFGYDTAGRQETVTSPMGKVQRTAYDTQGRVSEQTEPSGQKQVMVYDPYKDWLLKTQLLEPNDPNGALTQEISHTYDAIGQVLTTTDSAGIITRKYTADPRHLVKKYQLGTDVFSYVHDANGNQTLLTLPDGKTIAYAYDNRDRLTTLTDWADRITTLVWDVGSRLTSVTRPNGTVRTFFYDGASQMTRIEERTSAGRLIQMVRLGLDAVGRAEKRFTVPLPAAATFPTPSYTYNADNWITGLNYDLDGNMLQVPSVPAPTGQATFGAQPGILTTTGSTNNASWDTRNRLTSLTLADASTLAFTYDAEDLRLTKTRGSSTTRYIHNAHGLNGMSECTIEVLPDNSKRLYVWGGPAGLLYDVSISAGSTAETARYYHGDQVGSTMALTNQAGTVIGRADYTPYGLITLRSGDTNTPFLYNGAFGVMTDSETGLVHMRARYYHPWLARFINADPIGFEGGMNWFAFGGNNPLSFNDPTGLYIWSTNSSGSHVNFTMVDGSSLTTNLAESFVDQINHASTSNNKITKIEAWGHGNTESIFIGPNSMMDLVNMSNGAMSDGGALQFTNTETGALTRLPVKTLQKALSSTGSNVSLNGCNTARQWPAWNNASDNIAKNLSQALPNVPVSGYRGFGYGSVKSEVIVSAKRTYTSQPAPSTQTNNYTPRVQQRSSNNSRVSH